MTPNQIPTPETDAFASMIERRSSRVDDDYSDSINFARDLERRLAVAREALERLAKLGNGERYGNSEGNEIAREALAQTAPKQ